MSWNAYVKTAPKAGAAAAIDAAVTDTGLAAHNAQLAAAKTAAKALADTMSGPYISVSLYGYSNAAGLSKPGSTTYDSIMVNVIQMPAPA
jgi:hypothetical protein